MDAIEARRQFLHMSSAVGNGGGGGPRSFKTKHDVDTYWAEQALLWRGAHVDDDDAGNSAPNTFYRVSAERSTVTWEASLDSDRSDRGFGRDEEADEREESGVPPHRPTVRRSPRALSLSSSTSG